jgi:sugar O-acyltransferase (sialic acid O-acetyltransferase NeuD family)
VKPLVLYGGGGFGREVALLVHTINRVRPTWRLLGFLDDNDAGLDSYRGLPFLGGLDQLESLARDCGGLSIAICIGDIEPVRTLSTSIRCLAPAVAFPTLVHPTANVDRDWFEMGEGNIIAAGATVTVDVRIGSFNIVNVNAAVTHDSIVGDRCRVNPGAILNGGVKLGDEVTIGAGAILMPRISIGSGATVALGAVVGKDVLPGDTVAGNPSRVMRSNAQHA